MQYIARKYRPALLGSSVAESGKILMLLEKVTALKEKATATSEDPEATISECRPLLAKIVEVMGEDGQWITGQNPTWLDFYFTELLDHLKTISNG